jgi:hypothetical protein
MNYQFVAALLDSFIKSVFYNGDLKFSWELGEFREELLFGNSYVILVGKQD